MSKLKISIISLFLLISGIVIIFSTGSISADTPVKPIEINTIGIELIQVMPGSFQMGNLQDKLPLDIAAEMEQEIPGEEETVLHGDWDEKPVHPVNLSYPFQISATEVTIEQFRKFRPDYEGNDEHAPYATGISWEDAMAYCRWLSNREGKTYRLPTEAEWEYVARAGTTTPYWSGKKLPKANEEHPWNIKNIHTGVPEWTYDWYAPYPNRALHDPIGAEHGKVKVIRGGTPEEKPLDDQSEAYFQRSANRSGLPPRFDQFESYRKPGQEKMKQASTEPSHDGLVGLHYGNSALGDPEKVVYLKTLNSSEIPWSFDGNYWGLEYIGYLTSPVSGEIQFEAEADNGVIFEISDQTVIDGWSEDGERKGTFQMEAGKPYPVRLAYYKSGAPSFLRIYWTLPGEKTRSLIKSEAIHHSERQKLNQEYTIAQEGLPRPSSIGFRVVQAPLPDSQPWSVEKTFFQKGVKSVVAETLVQENPSIEEPFFRRNIIYPMPPDNRTREEIDAAGLHPSFRGHAHSPGMVVAANGDVIYISYSSYGEYEPGVSLMGTRLRYGAREWDFPSPVLDFPDVNMHAPMLWRDNK